VPLLAQHEHDGAVYPMAAKIGISPAIVARWAQGNVRNPTIESVAKVCRAYRLDFVKVTKMLARPFLGVLLTLTMGGVPASGGTQGALQLVETMSLIGNFVRRFTTWRRRLKGVQPA